LAEEEKLTFTHMDDISTIIWIVILVVTAVIEAATVNLVTLWFSVGALFAMAASLFGAPIWLETIIFFVVSIVSLIIFFPLVKKKLKVGMHKTNVDSIIGKEGVVVKKIAFNQVGQVNINGVIWPAAGENEHEIEEIVKVIGVEGNKVIVSRK
jgi:membrane protein implicated in regulation of membrane protease activity